MAKINSPFVDILNLKYFSFRSYHDNILLSDFINYKALYFSIAFDHHERNATLGITLGNKANPFTTNSSESQILVFCDHGKYSCSVRTLKNITNINISNTYAVNGVGFQDVMFDNY